MVIGGNDRVSDQHEGDTPGHVDGTTAPI